MPMPRVISGTAPSAGVFNTMADEVDALGAGCKVYRLYPAVVYVQTDQLINWHAVEYDTVGDMWDPANPGFITCQLAGVYSVTAQMRFDASGGNIGSRAGKILLNGTSVYTDSVASDKRGANYDAEGITCGMTAVVRLQVGDLLYASCWTSANQTINALQTDYGGTYMSVNRMGPLVG